MPDYKIFIVDDEKTIRDGISMVLKETYRVFSFSDAEGALKGLRTDAPDLVLLDIGLPGMNGIEAFRQMKDLCPNILIIMITAFEDIKTVISAMKLGAYDYIVKPIHMEGLEVTIHNALETVRLRKEVQTLQEQYLKENLPFFVAESDAIQDVMEFIGLVAKSPDTPILIQGETGTGKELIAGSIHYRSPNFKSPLITVNCAAIPKDLVESEMFGYEKGAFSGASASGKKGLIEEAAGGTLFLDEVGDLSLEAQSKLLRFLEEGEFYRLGGTKKIQIKTRIVSATNKDLQELIGRGLFRKDLYFRLGVIKIHIPALNERKDDILPITKYFLYQFNKKFEKDVSGISAKAEALLISYHWTGNVRELKNVIERAVLVCKGTELKAEDLGLLNQTQTEPTDQENNKIFPAIGEDGMSLDGLHLSLEKNYINEALKMAGGNESQAAKLLKMNHHTFRYRRKKLIPK